MGSTLYAGAARRAINPELGTGMPGLRLFGAPIQAIESDLTATVLVLGDGDAKVALIGVDLCITSVAEAGRLRAAVAEALGTPVSHVLLNLSHVHSSPALPEFMAMTDSAEDVPFRVRYEGDLRRRLVEAAVEADGRLRPARLGCRVGRELDRRLPARTARRARRAGRGARPPHRPLRRRHPRRRPRRRPDRRRLPLLGAPGHDGEPIAGRLPGLPRPGTRRARAQPGRARALPAGLRRQRQPARRHRLRGRLPRHQEPRRPRARGRGAQGRGGHPHPTRAGERRAARQRPEHPLHALGAGRGRHVHAPCGRGDDRPARVRRAAFARSRPGRSSPTGSGRARSDSQATRSTGRFARPRSTSTGRRSSSPRWRTATRPTTSTSRRSV